MSTLTDAVKARNETARLAQLTQKDTRSTTTIDDTVLATAAADATAEFEIKSGRTFDDTNAQHIRLVCPGVVAFLVSYKGQEASAPLLDAFARRCEDFRAVDVNRRITPQTNILRGPTTDVDADGTGRRPEFDRSRFRDLDVSVPPSSDPTGA